MVALVPAALREDIRQLGKRLEPEVRRSLETYWAPRAKPPGIIWRFLFGDGHYNGVTDEARALWDWRSDLLKALQAPPAAPPASGGPSGSGSSSPPAANAAVVVGALKRPDELPTLDTML